MSAVHRQTYYLIAKEFYKMNPLKMMQMKSAWDRFQRNHPKFLGFVNAVRTRGIHEGTVLELKVVTPEGEELVTNLKVQPDDIELFRQMKELAESQK
jgi:hypothetical protein